jgi:heat-inducible transcriptional repressor
MHAVNAPHPPALAKLDQRSRDIFRRLVESYLASGEPTGSRQISKILPVSLSPASVRNVMQDLESMGLLFAPHPSAGRLPTQAGLRFFVDSLLEFGDLGREEKALIRNSARDAAAEGGFENALARTTALVSEMSHAAGLVTTSKDNLRLKHVEFVRLDAARALAVLVGEDGSVENRVIPTPAGLPVAALVEAANYINAFVRGRTLGEARSEIGEARRAAQNELDALTGKLVEAGLASWSGVEEARRQLIVRGQAHLLGDVHADQDLERIRLLFADLETKDEVIDLLQRAEGGEGVKIFIGSENRLFSLSGSATIAAPLRGPDGSIAGALGVIGPTRINYGRIVPMVRYAAQVLGDLRGAR